MKSTQRTLIIRALLARGYSKLAARSEWSEWSTFAIDPGHARKLSVATGRYVGTRRVVGEIIALSETGAIRLRSRGQVGEGFPMPAEMRNALALEGRTPRAVKGLNL